ncbi:MAG: 2-amino-4-hydroxy-6-hydroxymethyldihydropteridine diphosphokinase [Gammaproteobacteria bacterium]|nr:2-amino-4-hydroxy-6-hydroxymethyldihydropteridine diphosphokinase [Gammaproteobacteria bacterium]
MCRAYAGIGSNVDRIKNLQAGVRALRVQFQTLIISNIYANSAVGFVGDDFYNLVVGFDTELSPTALNDSLHQIETAHGRRRGEAKFAPRTLDLDLLLYGDWVLSTPGLTLPRTDVLDYAFVLRPLAEIAGAERHPVLNVTYAELWQQHLRVGKPSHLTRVPDFLEET